MLEQLVCITSTKWWGTSIHFKAINAFINSIRQIVFRSHCQTMPSVPSSSSVRWNDLAHPVVAGLISVIVNYGGTFILVFQAAKVAGIARNYWQRPYQGVVRQYNM